MNKNELIEKAVLKLNGEFPQGDEGDNWLYQFSSGRYVAGASGGMNPHAICTREEFNAAADRMRGKPDWSILPEWCAYMAQNHDGLWWVFKDLPSCGEFTWNAWQASTTTYAAGRGKCIGDWRNTLEKRPERKADPLNGYEWGKEYPTNGKRPELPGEVFVQPSINGINWLQCSHKVSDIDWTVADVFKISDVRYKPEKAEPAPAKPWFEAGELPPVGTVCEVFNHEFASNAAWEKCTILFMGKFKCVYSSDSCHERVGHIDLPEIIKFRPIRTEREKAIDAAIEAMQPNALTGTMAIWFGKLYDAGLLRLPDQK